MASSDEKPPVVSPSTATWSSLKMAPSVVPPTDVTYGDDAGNFCSATKPESPEAKTSVTPRAPSAANSSFIRTRAFWPPLSDASVPSGSPTESEWTYGICDVFDAHVSHEANGLAVCPSMYTHHVGTFWPIAIMNSTSRVASSPAWLSFLPTSLTTFCDGSLPCRSKAATSLGLKPWLTTTVCALNPPYVAAVSLSPYAVRRH